MHKQRWLKSQTYPKLSWVFSVCYAFSTLSSSRHCLTLPPLSFEIGFWQHDAVTWPCHTDKENDIFQLEFMDELRLGIVVFLTYAHKHRDSYAQTRRRDLPCTRAPSSIMSILAATSGYRVRIVALIPRCMPYVCRVMSLRWSDSNRSLDLLYDKMTLQSLRRHHSVLHQVYFYGSQIRLEWETCGNYCFWGSLFPFTSDLISRPWLSACKTVNLEFRCDLHFSPTHVCVARQAAPVTKCAMHAPINRNRPKLS